MRVLITGGSGLLGRALVGVFSRDHSIASPAHAEMDITDPRRVREVIEEFQPDRVIHAAATPDVDRCEQDPDAAYRVNALGAQHVALACGEGDIPLVFISTDYVFDGAQRIPYTEFDETRALNIYGRAKIAAENAVRTFCRKHYIIRSAWLFAPWGKNFVMDTLARLRRGDTVRAVSDQYSSPTSAIDLAEAIVRLVAQSDYGVYHLANPGILSRYEMAQAICRAARLDESLAQPVNAAEVKRFAPRPAFTALRNYRLELIGQDFMRPFEKALTDCVAQL
ncbi:MAG: dTDP-4-dehydrorhamnose reductase [Chloroflexi bacterium]|nr:dTDP-4-dehydrorhamnose reductase [Chloroflexota bacterium]